MNSSARDTWPFIAVHLWQHSGSGLREENAKDLTLIQLYTLPGAVLQWAGIANLKVKFTFPILSIIPTLEEVKQNILTAKDTAESEQAEKEIENQGKVNTSNEEIAPSDQLGYIYKKSYCQPSLSKYKRRH